jgi:hypothetical protein
MDGRPAEINPVQLELTVVPTSVQLVQLELTDVQHA